MALADYYDRAALAASQVIAGFDEARFREALQGVTVGIGFGPEAAERAEGVALLDLTVRLLARLYPSLELRPAPGTAAGAEAERLATLAQRVNPLIALTEGAGVGISVGTDAPAFETTVFAGSDGWDALVSTRDPVPVGRSVNPLGAGVAACLAAAHVFTRVMLPDWEARWCPDGRLSTLTLEASTTTAAIGVPNDGWQLRGDAVLVGLGAVGNGAAWALGRASVEGRLHLVDHEDVELSNLQRYVMAERADEGRSKVDLAASSFCGPLEVVTHARPWEGFVEREGYEWPHVLVALDSARGRRAVQASLPKWLANAWTQPGDLGLSVHGRFDGPGACLNCLYLPRGSVANEDEVVAAALGIPHLVGDVRTLLHTGAGVHSDLLQAVASGLGLGPDAVSLFEGRPIRALYIEGVCGGGLLPLGAAGTPAQDLHVPLAHQSALAGVLLAAALAQVAVGRSDDSTTRVTRIDVLHALPEHPTQAALKAGTGVCICEDPDYRGTYARKYRSSLGGGVPSG